MQSILVNHLSSAGAPPFRPIPHPRSRSDLLGLILIFQVDRPRLEQFDNPLNHRVESQQLGPTGLRLRGPEIRLLWSSRPLVEYDHLSTEQSFQNLLDLRPGLIGP